MLFVVGVGSMVAMSGQTIRRLWLWAAWHCSFSQDACSSWEAQGNQDPALAHIGREGVTPALLLTHLPQWRSGRKATASQFHCKVACTV